MSAMREEPRPIEAVLHERVALAKAEYKRATAEARRLIESARDVGFQNPDGRCALNEATRIQQVATRRYTEALMALSDYALNRKAPEP